MLTERRIAGRWIRLGAVYRLGVVLVFAAEWGWAGRDPGWAPWAAGVTVSNVANLLTRQQLILVARLQAAQAELAEQTRLSERSRIARSCMTSSPGSCCGTTLSSSS